MLISWIAWIIFCKCWWIVFQAVAFELRPLAHPMLRNPWRRSMCSLYPALMQIVADQHVAPETENFALVFAQQFAQQILICSANGDLLSKTTNAGCWLSNLLSKWKSCWNLLSKRKIGFSICLAKPWTRIISSAVCSANCSANCWAICWAISWANEQIKRYFVI